MLITAFLSKSTLLWVKYARFDEVCEQSYNSLINNILRKSYILFNRKQPTINGKNSLFLPKKYVLFTKNVYTFH